MQSISFLANLYIARGTGDTQLISILCRTLPFNQPVRLDFFPPLNLYYKWRLDCEVFSTNQLEPLFVTDTQKTQLLSKYIKIQAQAVGLIV